jgi:hypothetical protein
MPTCPNLHCRAENQSGPACLRCGGEVAPATTRLPNARKERERSLLLFYGAIWIPVIVFTVIVFIAC